MKIVILDSGTLGDDLDLSPFTDIGDVTEYKFTEQNQVAERILDCDVVIINKIKLNQSNLSSCKNLKLICAAATGFDNIDIDYCKNNNIAVCNVKGYSTHSVAQLTLAMVLSLSTNLESFKSYVRLGSYSNNGAANCLTPVFHELYGKTWGIIGLGNIGRQVAKAANAIGCNILAYKKRPCEDYKCVSLNTLLTESDIISIHVPLNEETYHLINSSNIHLMKRNLILINAARGAVLDETAITNAVLENKIGGFGCDVYSIEPFPENHPYNLIKNAENVCLTPHMAWGALEARQRCRDEIIKNITCFFKGESRNRIV